MIIYVPYYFTEDQYNTRINRLNDLLAEAEKTNHDGNMRYYREQLSRLGDMTRLETKE